MGLTQAHPVHTRQNFERGADEESILTKVPIYIFIEHAVLAQNLPTRVIWIPLYQPLLMRFELW